MKSSPKLFFFTLLPDDYNGEPKVADVSPPGPLPSIPSEDDVYDAWAGSEYNSYNMGGGDEDIEDVFDEYGDSSIYYAIYMVIITDENIPKYDFDQEIYDITYQVELTPEELCEELKKLHPEISLIIPLK
jgi:hypothetical protein